MSYILPQDGWDTTLSQGATSTATTLYVAELPTVTAGVATVYEQDGRTIREKVYFTGVSSTPSPNLTGCVRGVRFVPVAGAILFTGDSTLATELSSSLRIAITDNINYTGLALSILNGDMETGGVLQNPATRTINSSRDVVDKEYADSLTISAFPNFLVTKNGSDPTLTVNVGSGQYIKPDGSNAAYAGGAAIVVVAASTNYVEMDTSGTVSVNQSAFTSGRYPLATVITSGTTITSVVDRRGILSMNDGTIDRTRTWSTVQSFTANNAQITTDPDSANDAVRKSYSDGSNFGDGSDGALAISSGTTTLNTASKQNYQYTSVAITGTGVLGFGSNLAEKPIYIFVQSDLTITSSATRAVDVRGLGMAGGAGSTGSGGFPSAGANATLSPWRFLAINAATGGGATGSASGAQAGGGGGGGAGYSNAGTNGTAGTGSGSPGAAGTGATPGELYSANYYLSTLNARPHLGMGGAGGGSGSLAGAVSGNGGNGGNGGGWVIFIVGGNINITGTLDASGQSGSNGSSSGSGGGGGGGAGGGFLGIFYYGAVTANSGTYTVAGGTGGTGGTGNGTTGGTGGTGGAGQSIVKQVTWTLL